MLGRLSMLVAALCVCSQSGCVSWQDAYALWSPSAPPSDYLPSRMPPNTSELAQLQPGDYGRFEVLAAPSEDAKAARRTTDIAGRIVQINAREVVLTDAVRTEAKEQVVPRGPFAGVPGINRLVTSTALVITPKPIDGEVRLPRPAIASASSIPAEAWEKFKQPREIAGVSSAFNAPTN